MFGRRRHAAPASASQLTEKQLFELVHARLADELGASGAWVLSRRLPDSGDEIFHEVFAQQLAHEIATDIDLEQAAVTVRAEARNADTARGWRLWGRQDATTDEGVEDAAVAAADVPAVESAEVVPDAAGADIVTVEAVAAAVTSEQELEPVASAPSAVESVDTAGLPTLVERTLLEPQHYPIAVWAEPELIDASLVNPVPAKRRSIA
ncbi:hypothetical protein ACL9RL_16675 [Plantibacter sp. Mn2098]|uniref:hypothetical protein n=1 Tax=Plantibacter sp. Mn2098 TaxID=3395266 RepID=UPI003BCFF782